MRIPKRARLPVVGTFSSSVLGNPISQGGRDLGREKLHGMCGIRVNISTDSDRSVVFRSCFFFPPFVAL